MVNKTQFYKTKVALAVVLSLGLAACGDSDGDANTSNNSSQTDSTQNTVGNQDNLSVSVSGVVVDTNNNGVPGASVTLAGVTVTTDDYGTYVFDSVDVTNVAGVNNEGNESDDGVGAALTIIISPSADYLGGTLTITPEAQVNNTGGQGSAGGTGGTGGDTTNNSGAGGAGGTGGTGGTGTNGDNSQVTIQTFISGQSYGAGKAVVPMLSAKITGYLTDCTVSTHDSVLAGVTVAADILSLGTSATETATPGSSFELSVPSPSTTTDADGMFTITLPADSVSNILVDGWGLSTPTTGTAGEADTNVIIEDQTSDNEQITENVGIIQVCPFVTPDTEVPNVAPQVTSVSDYYDVDVLVDGSDGGTVANDNYYTHAVDTSATEDETDTDLVSTDRHYGVVSEGVVNNFTINFSEALVDLEEVDLVVTLNNEAAPAGTVITLAADKASALITFPEDLEPQDLVDFYLPQWQAVDADGAGVVSEGEDYIDLGLQLDDTNKVGKYVRVSFCIFSRPDHDDAGITLIEQIIDADADEDGTFNALSDYSSSFADNDEGTTDIEQLNGQSLTDNRLDALAEEILATTDAGNGTEVDFDVNDARVSYEDKAGSVVVTVAGTGTVSDETGIYEIANTEDNKKVTATASNIFGVVKSTSTLTVFDKIAPTTVLQENYGITGAGAPKLNVPMVTTSVTSGVTFGNGGEATDGIPTVVGTVGNPIVYVQPRHLVARGTDINTFTERGNEFDALNEDMDDRLASGEATGVIGAYEERPSYDRQAIAAWDAQSQRIGIAVSEEISVIENATVGTANISTAITAPTAFNAVTINVDGVAGSATNGSVDLVAVSVADVVSLANADNGGVLSFANVIADTANTPNLALTGLGSVGGANAQVVLQDAFPPMVESAEWNGTSFTIVFNEGITVPTGTDTLELRLVDGRVANNATNTTITLDAAETVVTNQGYFTYDANTFTLVVVSFTDIEARFAGSATADQEWFYADDIAGSSSEEQHALLNWDAVEDLNGNSWDEFNGGADSGAAPADIEEGVVSLVANDRWEVNAPQFLAVNTLGQLDVDLDIDNTTYSPAVINTVADSDQIVTLLLTSTYALDIDNTFNSAGITDALVDASASGLVLSSVQVSTLLEETGFNISAASSGIISKDKMTITFNIDTGAVEDAANMINTGDTVKIDNTQLDNPDQAQDILGRVDSIQTLTFN